MVAFLLGIIDIIAAVSLFFLRWDLLTNLCIISIFLVLIKSVLFIKSLASILDIIAVIIAFLALFGVMYNIATYIAIIWLLQKGIASFY